MFRRIRKSKSAAVVVVALSVRNGGAVSSRCSNVVVVFKFKPYLPVRWVPLLIAGGGGGGSGKFNPDFKYSTSKDADTSSPSSSSF